MILCLALVGLLAGLGSGSICAASNTITFKVDHTGPATKTEGRALEWMADYLKSQSDGRIQMQVFHQGALCNRNGQEGFQLCQSGAIEMFVEANNVLAEWEPAYQVTLLPYLFSDMDELYKFVTSPVAEEMARMLEPKGFKVLGFWTRPLRQLTNNLRPVRKPGDLKGMKVRVPGSEVMIETFRSLGADPIPMAMGEVYTALQLKTIHAQENALTSIEANKMYEVCDYLTYWNYMADVLVVTVNKRWWDRLPDWAKTAIQDAVVKTRDWVYRTDSESEAKLLADLSSKMKVAVLTKEEKAEFAKALRPVWDKYIPVIGRELVAKTLQVLGKSL